MKYYLLIILTSVFFCTGCAPTTLDAYAAKHPHTVRQYDVFIDQNFPPDTIPVIQRAINDWAYKLQPVVEFRVYSEETPQDEARCLMDGDIEYRICIQPATPEELKFKAGLTTSYPSYHSAVIQISTDNFAELIGKEHAVENDTMYVAVLNWRSVLRTTMLHEFGHALQLKHDVAGTLMAPNGDIAANHITDRDIEQFVKTLENNP